LQDFATFLVYMWTPLQLQKNTVHRLST